MDANGSNKPGVPAGRPEAWKGRIQQRTSSYAQIDAYRDPGIAFPEGTTAESLVEDEIERITYFLILVVIANEIPRRLGGEASDAELAADKRRCRRVGWALRQSLASWGVSEEPDLSCDEETRRMGIQMDWLSYAADHALQVNESMRYCATWAYENNSPEWGRYALRCLRNELHWVLYALR